MKNRWVAPSALLTAMLGVTLLARAQTPPAATGTPPAGATSSTGEPPPAQLPPPPPPPPGFESPGQPPPASSAQPAYPPGYAPPGYPPGYAPPGYPPGYAPPGYPPGYAPPGYPPGYAYPPPARRTARPNPPPPDPTERLHDGFYLRIAGGLGALEDSHSSVSGFEGAGTIYGAAIGGTPLPGFVIGGGIVGAEAVFHSTQRSDFDSTSTTNSAATMALLGLHLDYYPDPRAGLHFELMPAVAVLTGGDMPESKGAGGVGVHAGAGYEWWVGAQGSIGAMLQLNYASVSWTRETTAPNGSTAVASEEKLVHSLVVPALVLTLTYH